MAFLKVNGIAVPVALDGASQDNEEFGASDRGAHATLVSHRYAFKDTWQFKVAHSEGPTALAFRELILGKGNVWSFETSLYSSRGVAMVTSGGAALTAVMSKYGAKSLSIPNGAAYATVAGILVGSWTVMFWSKPVPGYHHHVVRSDGAKWYDGARNDAADFSFQLDTSGGNLKLQNTSSGGGSYADGYTDDLVVLPYLVPTDWPAQVYAAAAAFGQLPNHAVSGDLVEFGSGSKTAKGSVEGTEIVRAGDGPRYIVKGTLKEV